MSFGIVFKERGEISDQQEDRAQEKANFFPIFHISPRLKLLGVIIFFFLLKHKKNWIIHEPRLFPED
jgi:hypothetical protein